jgi:phage terminase small subunit
MVKGETNPAYLASLVDKAVKASAETLQEALGGKLTATHRLLLKMYLEQWDLLASQIDQLNTRMAQALSQHQAAVHRLVEIPGVSLIAAQQIIAEVGPEASAFAAPEKLASWVGVCPRSAPKCGNRVLASFPKRQPHDAACPGPMCLGQREGQGEYLSPEIPRLGAPAGSAPGYLGDRPSVAADHLEAPP